MRRSALLLVGLALTGCRESPVGPGTTPVTLAILGDAVVYAAVDQTLAEPLRVAAFRAPGGSAAPGVPITWRVTQGSIGITQATSTTDEHGVAATSLLAAPQGTYRITASAPRMTGSAPTIEVRVVPKPVIQALQPAVVAAGATLTLTGSNFSADASHNAVYFDGVRGQVVAASPTQLTVTVPPCLPARNVSVRVGLGAVMSDAHALATTGGTEASLSLEPGEVRHFANGADLACIRLSGEDAGAVYMLAVHNATSLFAPNTAFELRTLTPQPLATAWFAPPLPAAARFAESWEALLRQRERMLGSPGAAEGMPLTQHPAVPSPGDRRDFNVLDSDSRFVKVTAAVRLVTPRAIIYVDVEAASAFTDADVSSFGATFDDPIYDTTVGVFGEPSDLDGNQRIIILFTPRVNALTPRDQQSSFIAGYFYGCDLVSRSRCSGSNQGEIFYSMVPDPEGRWSAPRSRGTVLNSVPPVLAHEFQHMIHYARRGFSADVLWLSEALAHTAEDLVAEVLAERGENSRAQLFRGGNHDRARQYLSRTATTSMVAEELPGSIELRGAGWLFLKHLRGHYGGDDLLRRLTASTRTGVANVTHETGQPWARLVTDFGVALFADGSPDVQGPVAPQYGFVGFDLRATLSGLQGSFPLRPTALGWGDIATSGIVSASAHGYYTFTAPPASSTPLTLVVTGVRGAPFAPDAAMSVSVLRVR